MSYSVTCYAVDINTIKQACGSKDEKLLAEIKRRHADELKESDEWFADEIKQGAPSRFEALSQLINNQEMNSDFGFQYGYAVEVLCMHYGQYVDAEGFQSMSGGYFWDLPEEIQSLVTSGAPVEIPEIDDFPTIGHKYLQDVEQALAQRAEFDPDTDEGEAWSQSCEVLQQSGDLKKDMVCFYY